MTDNHAEITQQENVGETSVATSTFPGLDTVHSNIFTSFTLTIHILGKMGRVNTRKT